MQCVILAGGIGTRLFPLTSKIPKCLIEINNIPFIDYLLNNLSSKGITDVVLCIGRFGDMVKDFVKNGSKYNLNVNYVWDGNDLCGTGGALRKAYDENVLSDTFFITYGDAFLTIDYKNIYEQFVCQKKEALMVVYNVENDHQSGNTYYKDNKVFHDKFFKSNPKSHYKYIDYGLSIINKQLIQKYIQSNKFYDLSDFFYSLSVENNLAGIETNKKVYEIGSFYGLKEFTDWILNEKNNNIR